MIGLCWGSKSGRRRHLSKVKFDARAKLVRSHLYHVWCCRRLGISPIELAEFSVQGLSEPTFCWIQSCETRISWPRRHGKQSRYCTAPCQKLHPVSSALDQYVHTYRIIHAEHMVTKVTNFDIFVKGKAQCRQNEYHVNKTDEKVNVRLYT